MIDYCSKFNYYKLPQKFDTVKTLYHTDCTNIKYFSQIVYYTPYWKAFINETEGRAEIK